MNQFRDMIKAANDGGCEVILVGPGTARSWGLPEAWDTAALATIDQLHGTGVHQFPLMKLWDRMEKFEDDAWHAKASVKNARLMGRLLYTVVAAVLDATVVQTACSGGRPPVGAMQQQKYVLDSVIEYDVVCSILKGNEPRGSVEGATPMEGAGEPRGSVDASSSSGGAIVPAALCVDVRHDPALEEVPPMESEAIVDDSASVIIGRAVTNGFPEPSPAESGFDEARTLAAAKVLAASLRHAKSCPGRAPRAGRIRCNGNCCQAATERDAE